jgi:hypothetical protein
MKGKIKKYVDDLFVDIYDTKQLRELKEEVTANLIEKVNDLVANGINKDEAFKNAVSSLGDMGELVENLKKASNEKLQTAMPKVVPLSKKHIIAYVVAAAILLFGIMTSGIVYLQKMNLKAAIGTISPFLMISVILFLYFGLTQESTHTYGMKPRRALLYCIATVVMLLGIFSAGYMYTTGKELFRVLGSFMPFAIPSAAIYIYLGLTEKNRTKMNEAWQKQWVDYYNDPQTMMVRGTISGALWIFSFAAFLVLGFTIGWRYSWIVFIFAVGFEVLIEGYFMAKKKR